MKLRLEYYGGNRQVDRMGEGKLRSLRKALLYSYQSATAIVNDNQEFRCLINPNKVTMDLDDKVLSIPFEDIELSAPGPSEGDKTSQSMVPIDVKVGSVIGWKETNTHWMIYSQYLQETAYFRGMMRQCDNEQFDLGNGKKRWVYIKGPDEKTINWQKTKNFIFNTLNYTLEMYISNDSDTNEFFHRFKKVTYKGKPWEVQAIDDITNEGLIVVYLKEDYTNEFADQVKDADSETDSSIEVPLPRISGDTNVYPFDIKEYIVEGVTGGHWSLSNKRAIILEQTDTWVKIEITTGKSGDVTLEYKADHIKDIIFNIKIQSL